MEKFRRSIYIILCAISIIIALCSVLSIFWNTQSQLLKILDFPRLQFFIASCISLVWLLLLIKHWRWYEVLFVMGLVGSMVIQGSYLKDYTTLVPEAVPSVNQESASSSKPISILLANVKMTNRNSQPLVDLIASKKPDLIIAMEVDEWWDKELQPIEEEYPHTLETINSVTYGMTLYSKYELKDTQVNYLSNRKVPSFESVVKLQNGKTFILYSLHPVPPTHYEHLPDNEGDKEVAMEKLGNKIQNRSHPVIVAGDFNDVSWGRTDRLTETDGILHDVRVGRGMYSSYNADNIFLRWPLDHIFVTDEFGLIELVRLPDIGSDHFPIYAQLILLN